MTEAILKWDYALFFLINIDWANAVFDTVMPLLRNKFFWAPVYLFLLMFFILSYGKKSLAILLSAIVLIVLCDQISSSLLKPMFERARPCQQEAIALYVNTLIKCGAGFSFPSSHAANHFGLSVFLGLLLSRHRWVFAVTLLWAVVVSYAQIYVGVHFPLDVIAGGILGSGIGILVYWGCKKAMEADFLNK